MSKNETESFIKEREWKFQEGYHIGDHLKFESLKYEISNDTIYQNELAIAVIRNVVKGQPGQTSQIEIRSISTEQEGTYVEL
ncbi:MAG: hypothetical protein WKF87_08700 [Chryseolinea sp.]